MNKSERFWLTESDLPLGKEGIRIQVAVDEVLFDQRSQWGHIQVLATPFFGKMLAIDGIIQVSESDEFIYHEMMTVLPSLQQAAPKKLLIIGGGDGGALRQATRIKSLEKIVQVEIDDTVTRVSRQYIPEISQNAFDDPRVELIYADGADYVATTDEKFDVTLLDLTDPVPGSPAEKLFENDFLTSIKNILTPTGVVSLQCGSLLLQPDEVRQQIERFNRVFGHSRLHHAVVPTYQLTSFGFLLGSKAPLENLSVSLFAERQQNISGESRYLTAEIYVSSSVLPPYLREQLFDSAA